MKFIKSKTVKTRKEHKYFGCGRNFPVGSILDAITFSDDGKIETNYWCEVCQEYWNRYMQPGDLIMFGELRSEDREGWEEIKIEIQKGVE